MATQTKEGKGQKRTRGHELRGRTTTEYGDRLKTVAAQTGLSEASLVALGTERLLDEIERTGTVPLPKVNLSANADGREGK